MSLTSQVCTVQSLAPKSKEQKPSSDGSPSAFGKILSNTIPTMGPNKFCRWLLDNNFAFRNGQGKIIPMQDAVNRGILILTERIDTGGKIRPQLLVTPAGQSYFANILS